jgi:hypothetical protein
MQRSTSTLHPGADGPAADSERIATLERQVADLAAQVDKLTSQAFVFKTLQEIRVAAGPGRHALQAAFDAGMACARENPAAVAAARVTCRL